MMKRILIIMLTASAVAACRPGPAPQAPDPAVALARYEIRAEIDPSTGSLDSAVDLTLTAPGGGLTSLDFLLHSELAVRSVRGDGVSGHRFGPPPGGPALFAPEAYLLSVDFREPLREGATLQLAFEYGGRITRWSEWSANVVTSEWVELGLYFPWFPHREEMGLFSYRLDIGCPHGYELRAGVEGKKKDGRWLFDEHRPSRDIVAVASERLRTRTFGVDGPVIHVHSVSLGEETIALLADDLSLALGLFQDWFGDAGPSSSYMTVIQSPRAKGGGYARNNLVVLGGLEDRGYVERREGYIRYLAHEAAHNWWWRAPVDTWEDWLNEGLAEYSALAVVREIFGPEAFERRLHSKKEVSASAGAIWGFDRADRSSEEALNRSEILLYSKAPVLLFELENRLGVEKMRALCRMLVRTEASSTEAFLEALAKHAGAAEHDLFQNALAATTR